MGTRPDLHDKPDVGRKSISQLLLPEGRIGRLLPGKPSARFRGEGRPYGKSRRFLDTGEAEEAPPAPKAAVREEQITEAAVIEPHVVCSQKHRAFFEEKIGKSFSFSVPFQRWLKENAGKTYGEALQAYYRIQEEKKKHKPPIDRQFVYNTYIRDFFADNPGRSLEEAIRCWKYKKSLPGPARYARSDLAALE